MQRHNQNNMQIILSAIADISRAIKTRCTEFVQACPKANQTVVVLSHLTNTDKHSHE